MLYLIYSIGFKTIDLRVTMKKVDDYIFVSYARANSDRVIPVIEDLKKNGYNVWYDRETCA